MAERVPPPPPPSRPTGGAAPARGGLSAEDWIRLAWTYGFALFFAVVCVGFGVWFGIQLMNTQEDGVRAIYRIQDVENAQAQQLAEVNQRQEATNDTLRVTNDRIDRLGDQVAALTRLHAPQGPQGGTP